MVRFGVMKLTYTRILVKISGEQLAGKEGFGFDVVTAKQIAGEIAQVVALGAEVVVIVGGGNFMRGAQGQGQGIQRVNADFMGMLGGVMNAIATADVFSANSVPAHALSPVMVEQMIDYYTQRRALHHLRKGRVIIIGGGIARPYFTHDTAAVSLALELDCDAVIKVTKVDGVYSRDPAKYADAKRFDHLTFDQAVSDSEIKVMDKSALGLAMEQNKKIVVCDLDTPGNLKKLVTGESIGTLIG